MSEETGAPSWNAAVWVLMVLAIGLLLGVGLALTVHVPQNGAPPGPPGSSPPPVAVTQTSVLLSTVCLVLLTALIVVYGRNYWATRAPYVLGLTVFLVVLFFTTLVNSPLLFTAFGIGPGNLGRFLALSEFLLAAALSLFLYLSLQ